MADPVTMMMMVAMGAQAAGSIIGARGQMEAGEAAQAQADYVAKQERMKANEELAAASVERDKARREKNLALSRLQAVSAGSGFLATDPTNMQIADEIAEYGTLQEQMTMYGGINRARGLRDQARATRMSGRAAMTGARYQAAGTILSGVSSMASLYGGSKPGTTGSTLKYG
jgi:hypothetical protein